MPAAAPKDIFLDLIDLPEGERASALDSACAGDADLRARVLALLDAHRRAPAVIVEPTAMAPTSLHAPGAANRSAPNGDLAVGTVVGAYTIERVLGEGGFGTVYQARQDAPVRRIVAMKVIRLGMNSREIIARFEAERQALAVMDHPGIARVFDAGTTTDGRPYFVMERVDGQSITDFCDAQALDLRARLELFEQVCMAVQHAHGKGVIHRDLKPSNILVAKVDGRPLAKVIDFGIAKALHRPLVPDAAVTLPSQVIGTPMYMSPEQATPDAPDVDARADVYSLGVILYELLAGTGPFDAERFRAMGLLEIERIIREEDPPRPSARVRAMVPARRSVVAAARATDDGRLVRALDGDLDWIVLRAIEKDRERRYGAPLALAADVRRFLRFEPVEAGPPTASYRIAKFARRHRVEVVAGAVVLLSLLAFAGVSAWMAWREHQAALRAERQLARADALADFSTSILTSIDPAIARGKDTALLQDVLDRAGSRVEGELSDHPESAVSVLNAIGYAFTQIGDPQRAERIFRRAANTARSRLGEEHALTIDAAGNLATALTSLNRYDEALPLLRGVVKMRERHRGPEHPKTLEALSNLAYLYAQTGNYAEARPILERLVEVRRRVLGPSDPSTLVSMNNLASAMDEMGDVADAAAMFERVLEAQIASDSEDSPRALATLNNLAGCYRSLGRLDEAVDAYERSLASKRRVLPEGHPSTINTLVNLGSVLIDLRRMDEGRAVLTEALDFARAGGASTAMHRIGSLNALGRLHRLTGEASSGIPLLEEAVQTAEGAVGPRHPILATLWANLASSRLEAGDAPGAERDARASLRLAAETIGPSNPSTVLPRMTLARALLAQERFAEALEVLDDLAGDQAALAGAPDQTLAQLADLRAQARPAP